jgi:hypothetical protein
MSEKEMFSENKERNFFALTGNNRVFYIPFSGAIIQLAGANRSHFEFLFSLKALIFLTSSSIS